jgi:hypothetical protein
LLRSIALPLLPATPLPGSTDVTNKIILFEEEKKASTMETRAKEEKMDSISRAFNSISFRVWGRLGASLPPQHMANEM